MEITHVSHNTIRSVVENQLEAFQKDDAELAFALASPEIQVQFITAKNFLNTVKSDYQPVYRPRSVLFEEITMFQGYITQPVLLLAEDGNPVRALYLMAQQSDQKWKIKGCFLVPVEFISM
mgnify:FL=1